MKRIALLKRSLFAILFLIAVFGCDENKLEPLEKNTNAPGLVKDVIVENLPGSAKLTYKLPLDQDLLYVKAEYVLANGKSMEVRSSYYNNSLVVDGFFDTNEHEVKLYSVNRSGVVSNSVSVMVKPEESPIWAVFRSISVTTSPSRVGVVIKALNPTRANVSLLVMQKSKITGEWELLTTIATSTDNISNSFGNDDIGGPGEHELAIYVRDRWLNLTTAYNINLTTVEEVPILKSKYKAGFVPGDTPLNPDLLPGGPQGSIGYGGMWDGTFVGWPRAYLTVTTETSKPNTVTIDIGELAQLTHITIWDYPEYGGPTGGPTLYYNRGNLKDFEIWGSENKPADDGSYADWHLLGKYNATKPSGQDFGIMTNEDFLTASAGFNWDFNSENIPKVRYIKIVSIKNWAGDQCISISEIQVYKAK